MLFTDRKWVDEQWSRIAHSLGDPTGALALHPACMAAKVSASEYKEGQGYLVCIYVKDAFDVRAVGEGLAILRDELRIATGYFKTDAMVRRLVSSISIFRRAALIASFVDRRSLGFTPRTYQSANQRCTPRKVRSPPHRAEFKLKVCCRFPPWWISRDIARHTLSFYRHGPRCPV